MTALPSPGQAPSSARAISADDHQRYLKMVEHARRTSYSPSTTPTHAALAAQQQQQSYQLHQPLQNSNSSANNLHAAQTQQMDDTADNLRLLPPNSTASDGLHTSSVSLFTALGFSRRQRIAIVVAVSMALLLCAAIIGFEVGQHYTSADTAATATANVERDSTQLVVVSLDGFRASYLQTYASVAPTLQSLMQRGIYSSVQPIFPSITFPNHYSIATGLYAESHGITANHFHDGTSGKTFNYGAPASFHVNQWWLGEPVWINAEKWNITTGVSMWPGSDQAYENDIAASYLQPFTESVTLSSKVQTILQWMKPEQADSSKPPATFTMLYVPEIDATGHAFGLNSTELQSAIANVDTALGQLIYGLKEQHLYDTTDIVIVSDHGMASDYNNFVYIDDIIAISRVNLQWSTWGAFAMVWPTDDSDTQAMYSDLANAHDKMTVWLREDVPQKYHFSSSKRIAPIVVMMDESYILNAKAFTYRLAGDHGYEPSLPSMQGVFVAAGPHFKQHGDVTPASDEQQLRTIDHYPLMCQLLGISPASNNGTVDVIRSHVLR